MRQTTQSGFTLLEVLVAFLLAGLLLSVVLSAFANGVSGWSRTDAMAQAASIAQSRLAEVGVLLPVAEAEYSGSTEDDRLGFQWQVRIWPLSWDFSSALLEQGKVLYRVEVVVSWPASFGVGSYRLESLRLQDVET